MEQGRQRTVLVADDEAQVRTYIAKVLERHGFHVLEASDGTDALARLHQMHGAVDLLVTDINMPEMSGHELVSAASCDFPGLPVVYVSGGFATSAIPDAHGRTAYLAKPFAAQALLETVCAMIDQPTTSSAPITSADCASSAVTARSAAV